MSEKKWTPGPWRVSGLTVREDNTAPMGALYGSAVVVGVAYQETTRNIHPAMPPSVPIDDSTAYANARLIAAAPELYAALTVALDVIRQALAYSEEMRKVGRGATFEALIPGTSCGLLQNEQLPAFLEVALAKARGES